MAYSVSHNEKTKFYDQFNSTSRDNTSTVVADTFCSKVENSDTFIVAQNQTRRCNGYCCAKPNATIVENATLSIEKVERLPWEMHKVLKFMMGFRIDCNHHACKSMNLTEDLTKPRSCKVHEPHRRLNEAKNLYINAQDEMMVCTSWGKSNWTTNIPSERSYNDTILVFYFGSMPNPQVI